MKRSRNLGVISVVAIALALGLVAAIVVGQMTRTHDTLVAVRDIPTGTPLSAEMFVIQASPGDPPADEWGRNLLVTRDDLEGVQGLFGRLATSNISAGVPLYKSMFFIPGSDPNPGEEFSQFYTDRFSQLLPQDGRAVVLAGDPTSPYARPGDFVDVFYYFESTDGIERVVRMFTTRVLYVIIPPPPLPDEPVTESRGTVYILDTDPQQAQDLVYAEMTGAVRIAIANPTSGEPVPVVPTDPFYFEQRYGIPAAPEPSPDPGLPTDGLPTFEPGPEPAPTEEPEPAPTEGSEPEPQPEPTSDIQPSPVVETP